MRIEEILESIAKWWGEKRLKAKILAYERKLNEKSNREGLSDIQTKQSDTI